MGKSTWFNWPATHLKLCAHDHSDWSLTRRMFSWLKLLWGLRTRYESRRVRERVKNVNHKIRYKFLSSKVYNSFILKLSYYHRTVIVEITQNTGVFQNTCFKGSYNWRLKESLSNYKLLQNTMTSSYQME